MRRRIVINQNHILRFLYAHLFIYLISIKRFPVGVSTGVKRAHKLVVVNEAIIVHVKDVGHCVHLQRVCGKFYSRNSK